MSGFESLISGSPGGLPPRGALAEETSLFFQAGRRGTPTNYDIDRMIQCAAHLAAEIHDACDHCDVSLTSTPPSWENIRLWIAANPESSPGLPWARLNNTKEYWVTEPAAWAWLQRVALERISLLEATPSIELAALSAEQKVAGGYCDPVRLFVKNEVHPAEKLRDGRLRLIASLSIVDQMVELWFSGWWLKRLPQTWQESPLKPGLSLDDKGLAVLSAEMLSLERPWTGDVSGFDWGVTYELQTSSTFVVGALGGYDAGIQHLKLELIRATPLLVVGGVGSLVESGLKLGNAYGLARPGIMVSGRPATSLLNSIMQVLSMKMAVGPSTRQCAAGDDGFGDLADSTPEHVVAYYTGAAMRMKDIQVLSSAVPLEFCSHLFHSDGRVDRANIEKAVINCLSKPVRDWAPVCFEAIRSPLAAELFALLDSRGEDVPSQARELAAVHIEARRGARNKQHAVYATDYSMAKDGSAKRDPEDIKAAAAKGRRSIAKAVHKDIARSESPKPALGVNSYLAATVDPEFGGKGANIPDGETIPSVKFQTRFVDQLRTDANGNVLACHTPALTWGGVHPLLIYNTSQGYPADDPFISALSSAGIAFASPTGISQGYAHHLLAEETIEAMQTNFAAFRPVSMVSKFVPTEALLGAEGSINCGIASRQQMVGSTSAQNMPGNLHVSNAVPPTVATGTPVTIGPFDLINTNNTQPERAVSRFSDLISGAQYNGNITKPVNCVWRFEDSQDYVYRDAIDEYDYNLGGGGAFPVPIAAQIYKNYNQESTLAIPVAINQEPGGSNRMATWFSQGGLGYIQANDDGASGQNNWEKPNENWMYPWSFWAVTGASPTTVVGQVTHIINWEAIPITGVASVMSTTPSPANPLEIAQVSNIVPSLPPAYDPTNGSSPETKLYTAAKKAATDLYDPSVPHKDAIEGKSWLKKAGSTAAKLASAVLPFPLSMVATGASALLDSL